jgi:hypothetical protein
MASLTADRTVVRVAKYLLASALLLGEGVSLDVRVIRCLCDCVLKVRICSGAKISSVRKSGINDEGSNYAWEIQRHKCCVGWIGCKKCILYGGFYWLFII